MWLKTKLTWVRFNCRVFTTSSDETDIILFLKPDPLTTGNHINDSGGWRLSDANVKEARRAGTWCELLMCRLFEPLGCQRLSAPPPLWAGLIYVGPLGLLGHHNMVWQDREDRHLKPVSPSAGRYFYRNWNVIAYLKAQPCLECGALAPLWSVNPAKNGNKSP